MTLNGLKNRLSPIIRIGVLSFVLFSVAGCNQYKHITYERNKPDKPLKIVPDQANKRFFTHFIHIEDTIYQLSNIQGIGAGDDSKITGTIAKLDTQKIELYNSIVSTKKFKLSDSIENTLFYQAHHFTSEINIDKKSGRCEVIVKDIYRYETIDKPRILPKIHKKGVRILLYFLLFVSSIAIGLLLLILFFSKAFFGYGIFDLNLYSGW
ncbi:MAG: hypothetical protein EP305_13455 [Bacteroidetes bacterium]|nr:MAG: hypothetical protein EP305_13455 [Bacteroidota bacterium]